MPPPLLAFAHACVVSKLSNATQQLQTVRKTFADRMTAVCGWQVWTFLVSDASFKTSATGSGSTISAPEVHVDKVKIIAVRIIDVQAVPRAVIALLQQLGLALVCEHALLGRTMCSLTEQNAGAQPLGDELGNLAVQVDAKLVVL
jgi:Transcription initiation factor IIA, gamma subunit